jgi:hypothetical protein
MDREAGWRSEANRVHDQGVESPGARWGKIPACIPAAAGVLIESKYALVCEQSLYKIDHQMRARLFPALAKRDMPRSCSANGHSPRSAHGDNALLIVAAW